MRLIRICQICSIYIAGSNGGFNSEENGGFFPGGNGGFNSEENGGFFPGGNGINGGYSPGSNGEHFPGNGGNGGYFPGNCKIEEFYSSLLKSS